MSLTMNATHEDLLTDDELLDFLIYAASEAMRTDPSEALARGLENLLIERIERRLGEGR